MEFISPYFLVPDSAPVFPPLVRQLADEGRCPRCNHQGGGENKPVFILLFLINLGNKKSPRVRRGAL